MGIFKEIKTFVLESDAVAGLQTRMMMNKWVAEPFKPIFKVLDAEDKLEEIIENGYKDDISKFYKEIARARK